MIRVLDIQDYHGQWRQLRMELLSLRLREMNTSVIEALSYTHADI